MRRTLYGTFGMLTILIACMATAAFMATTGRALEKTPAQVRKTATVGVIAAGRGQTSEVTAWAKSCGMNAVPIGLKADPSELDGIIVAGCLDDENDGTDGRRVELIRRFVTAGKPVLGISGGDRVVNAAFGGTARKNENPEISTRKVFVSGASEMREAYGTSMNAVVCGTGTVVRLGKGLRATQTGNGGKTVYGLEHKALPAYGIEWCPEKMGENGKPAGERFAQECEARML